MFKKLSLISFLVTISLFTLFGCSQQNKADSVNTHTAKETKSSTSDVKGGLGISKSVNSDSSSPQAANDSQKPTNTADKDSKVPVNSGHKIILTGNISIDTLKFDDTVTKTTEYINSIGGYTESSTIKGKNIEYNNKRTMRTASFSFKVPNEHYNELFTKIKNFGTVTSEQSTGQDITDQYFDTEARLKSLKIQEERELALLEKASNLSDILQLEKELNNIRYQIENYTGTLKKWDNLVKYSTVNVEIREVEETKIIAPEKSQGLWVRISYGFTNSVKALGELAQNIIVTISILLPFIVILGLVVFIVLLVVKKFKNKYNRKKENDNNKN